MIFGYCRVSTERQRLIRQINNIKAIYPTATILKEFYTGTSQDRPIWKKLINRLKPNDTIVFDSVSRMSRNADEGFEDYKMLYEKNVNLVFLNEPLINTDVYKQSKTNLLNLNISTGNKPIDDYFKGNVDLINKLLLSLAEQQIKLSFVQSEKEVQDLHKRISEGMREASYRGSRIGLPKGSKLITKKSRTCKDLIKKHSKDFNGSLNDQDLLALCNCSRVSFYKYKKEVKQEMNN